MFLFAYKKQRGKPKNNKIKKNKKKLKLKKTKKTVNSATALSVSAGRKPGNKEERQFNSDLVYLDNL